MKNLSIEKREYRGVDNFFQLGGLSLCWVYKAARLPPRARCTTPTSVHAARTRPMSEWHV